MSYSFAIVLSDQAAMASQLFASLPSGRLVVLQLPVDCRQASLQARPRETKILIHGAMEDRAIVETARLLRLATTDKFPEVRDAAANLGSLMAPMLLHTGSNMAKSSDG